MPFDGLRPYLETLEKKGLFKWVEREVDRDWEIATFKSDGKELLFTDYVKLRLTGH